MSVDVCNRVILDADWTCSAERQYSCHHINWAHLGINWPVREGVRPGNTEIAGSQATKHPAPDSVAGQMAELQHDGTNMQED